MHRTLRVVLLLFLLLLSLGPGKLVFAWQEPTNLLQNPGFEGDYYPWFGLNTVQVAHGWTPWWRSRTDADPPAYYFQPEYKQANGYIYPNRVHGGAAAQQWFTFHATHQAGMYQQVFNVTPGTRYRFTIWAQVWSSTQDDPNVSIDPASPNLQVGIDPTGQWDAWSGSVIWSGSYAFYDSWRQLAVEAVAQNNVITVFMRSNPAFPVKHNDMYWDDAVLIAVGTGGEPSPPTATSVAPAPATATSAIPPSPTATCAPAPSDWVTYYVQRGDTLYSLAGATGTTLERVVSVNCLSTTNIYVGQALLLPRLPPTDTPISATATPVPATATSAPATATTMPSNTPTTTRTATPTRTTTAALPTATEATETPTSTSVATATPTKPRATIPPPSTPTPGSPVPPPTSTPKSESTRPCGTIAVGAGIVLVAGVFRFRRRDRLVVDR